jgi:hypothetical protein
MRMTKKTTIVAGATLKKKKRNGIAHAEKAKIINSPPALNPGIMEDFIFYASMLLIGLVLLGIFLVSFNKSFL